MNILVHQSKLKLMHAWTKHTGTHIHTYIHTKREREREREREGERVREKHWSKQREHNTSVLQ